MSTKNKIVISPNPVLDILVFKHLTRETNARLYNQMGQEVFKVKLQKGNSEIDMSKLRTGIYIIKLDNGDVYRVVKA